MYHQLLTFFSLMFLTTITAAKCDLTVQAIDYPPYIIEDSQGQFSGLDIELADALLKEANCRMSFSKVSWKRGLYLLKNGGLDVVTGVSMTPEREQYITFVGPMRFESMNLLVSVSNQQPIKSLDDIMQLPKPLGIIRGVFYGPEFEKKYAQDKNFAAMIAISSTNIINFRNLIQGRLSGVIGEHYNIVYQLKSHNLMREFKINPLKIHDNLVNLGFSKKTLSSENLIALRAANTRLLKSGVYQSIIDKYYR